MNTKYRMWDIISTENYGSPYEILDTIFDQPSTEYLIRYTDSGFSIEYLPEYPVSSEPLNNLKTIPVELFKVPWDD